MVFRVEDSVICCSMVFTLFKSLATFHAIWITVYSAQKEHEFDSKAVKSCFFHTILNISSEILNISSVILNISSVILNISSPMSPVASNFWFSF